MIKSCVSPDLDFHRAVNFDSEVTLAIMGPDSRNSYLIQIRLDPGHPIALPEVWYLDPKNIPSKHRNSRDIWMSRESHSKSVYHEACLQEEENWKVG